MRGCYSDLRLPHSLLSPTPPPPPPPPPLKKDLFSLAFFRATPFSGEKRKKEKNAMPDHRPRLAAPQLAVLSYHVNCSGGECILGEEGMVRTYRTKIFPLIDNKSLKAIHEPRNVLEPHKINWYSPVGTKKTYRKIPVISPPPPPPPPHPGYRPIYQETKKYIRL